MARLYATCEAPVEARRVLRRGGRAARTALAPELARAAQRPHALPCGKAKLRVPAPCRQLVMAG